jgi:hypothetical protein
VGPTSRTVFPHPLSTEEYPYQTIGEPYRKINTHFLMLFLHPLSLSKLVFVCQESLSQEIFTRTLLPPKQA